MRKAGDKQRLRPGLADFGDILAEILGVFFRGARAVRLVRHRVVGRELDQHPIPFPQIRGDVMPPMAKASERLRAPPPHGAIGQTDILGKIRSERLPPAAVRLVVTPRRKRRVARNVERDRRREPRGEPVMRSDFEFQRLGCGYVFISSVVSVTRADADMRIAAVIACLSF